MYFGYEKRWNKPLTLYDCLDIPEGLEPYVNDYRVNLFEIAYLEDEQVKMFQSDFRIVADYFVQMRKNRNYVAPESTIQHVHELLQLMSVLTGDQRFEEVYNNEMEGRNTTMCEVLDRIENRGIEKGILQGITQGISQGIAQGISQGIAQGISQGEDTAFSLVKLLMENNRLDDLKKATEDGAYRHMLLQEFFPEKA